MARHFARCLPGLTHLEGAGVYGRLAVRSPWETIATVGDTRLELQLPATGTFSQERRGSQMGLGHFERFVMPRSGHSRWAAMGSVAVVGCESGLTGS